MCPQVLGNEIDIIRMKNLARTNHQTNHHNRHHFIGVVILLLAIALPLSGCRDQSVQINGSIPPEMAQHMTYEVIQTYPHDPGAFTQGLVYHDGYLYESTGLYGASSLRKVSLETGAILRQVDLPPDTFGEGLALWGDRLLQLTWRENRGFIYALDDFSLLDEFAYPMEGWGLTQDGKRLILSDGTHRLYFLDPVSLTVIRQVEVTDGGVPIIHLNELEYINGEVFANIWLTDDIVRIDPSSGEVLGWIDLRDILPAEMRTPDTDVLNGIAYDHENNHLFVTGKHWPLLFEIRLVPLTIDH